MEVATVSNGDLAATPLVSVIIDNYNYARFLQRAIDSVLAQSYGAVELIVVDDGSTDDSLAVARAYGDRLLLVDKANGGQASAINAGYAVSRGAIVIVLDSDDELRPGAVDAVVRAMAPGVAKVHWRLVEVDADGVPSGHTNPPASATLPSGDVVPRLLSSGRYTTPVMSGNAYSRDALDQILPMPEESFRRTADGYLTTLAVLHGDVAAVDEPLGLYRRHGGNGWAADRPEAGAFRGHLERELARHVELRRAASALGLPIAEDLELADQSTLRTRLACLRLDPAHHPVPGDHRLGLLWMGLRSAARRPGSSHRGRLAFVAWFAGVALAPTPAAIRLITWLYAPATRPRLLRRRRSPS